MENTTSFQSPLDRIRQHWRLSISSWRQWWSPPPSRKKKKGVKRTSSQTFLSFCAVLYHSASGGRDDGRDQVYHAVNTRTWFCLYGVFQQGKCNLKTMAWERFSQTRGGTILDSNLGRETISPSACARFSWGCEEEAKLFFFFFGYSPPPLLFLGWEGCFTTGQDTEQTQGLGTIKSPEEWVRILPLAKGEVNRQEPWVAASRWWSVRTWKERNSDMALPEDALPPFSECFILRTRRRAWYYHLEFSSERENWALDPQLFWVFLTVGGFETLEFLSIGKCVQRQIHHFYSVSIRPFQPVGLHVFVM